MTKHKGSGWHVAMDLALFGFSFCGMYVITLVMPDIQQSFLYGYGSTLSVIHFLGIPVYAVYVVYGYVRTRIQCTVYSVQLTVTQIVEGYRLLTSQYIRPFYAMIDELLSSEVRTRSRQICDPEEFSRFLFYLFGSGGFHEQEERERYEVVVVIVVCYVSINVS